MALDHRNNLRNSLRPSAPDQVPDAELVAFNELSTGASNDLKQATSLARAMVTPSGDAGLPVADPNAPVFPDVPADATECPKCGEKFD